MKAILMAGGVGSRLWPMSRETHPKQFCAVVTDQSLLRDAYERVLPLFGKDQIYVATTPELASLVAEQLPEVDQNHLFVEPCARDTGPAMGLVALRLLGEFPDEPIVFVPTDHLIRHADLFRACLKRGLSLVEQTGMLVDVAVPPTFAHTGLGYTKVGYATETHEDFEVRVFERHTEKPPFPIARAYVEDGSYFWHASYYMWTPKALFSALTTYAPRVAEALEATIPLLQEDDREALVKQYQQCPKISFDYLVTENIHPESVRVIVADLGWSDVGTWDAVYNEMAQEHQNLLRGDVVPLNTWRSLIYAEPGKTVAVIGLDEVVVVDTKDALLICDRKSAQSVKEVVELLKKRGSQVV